jgi:hypothetical protein
MGEYLLAGLGRERKQKINKKKTQKTRPHSSNRRGTEVALPQSHLIYHSYKQKLT